MWTYKIMCRRCLLLLFKGFRLCFLGPHVCFLWQTTRFPCDQPFSVVSCSTHLPPFRALLLSNLLLLISSEKSGDKIRGCVKKKKGRKTITKQTLWTGLLRKNVMCMGLNAEICNNTAMMFAWSQKAEMVKKQLLKKWVVLLSLKCTGIFLAKRCF